VRHRGDRRYIIGGEPLSIVEISLEREGTLTHTGESYDQVVEICRSGFFRFTPPIPQDPSSLSIVIATTGRNSDTLVSVIEAITTLSPRPELIVVLDGAQRSHERRRIIALVEEFGGTAVENSERRGASSARNHGAAQAHGDLLLFLDDDVLLPSDGLHHLLSYFELPQIVAVAPRVIQSGSNPTLTRSFPLDMGDRWSMVGPHSRVRYVPTALLIVRKTQFFEAGGFDRDLEVGEDVDLVWRLQPYGDIIYDPRAVAIHNEIRSTSEKFLRSYRYGLSYRPLHQRFPEYVHTKPRTLFDWLALTLPPTGLRGIGVVALLPALKPALSSELRHHFGPSVQRALVIEIVRRVAQSSIDRWSHALLLPFVALAFTSRTARRSFAFIIGVKTLQLLLQSRGRPKEIQEHFVGAFGYSWGYNLSLLKQWGEPQGGGDSNHPEHDR
jgi:GT2 family glycosyltransferase